MTDREHDRAILEPLADFLLEESALSVQEERRRLWADHQALLPTPRAPVCVTWEGIPGPQWQAMLGADPIRCRGQLARELELDLRRRQWAAQHIPDDHVGWPSVVVGAVVDREADWGVPLVWAGTRPGVDDPLEARRIVAPFADGIEVGRVRFTDVHVDAAVTRLRAEQTAELLGGRLAVRVRWPDLGHSPFDLAARMCGLEHLMIQCAQDPQRVSALMDRITEGLLVHHAGREREGRVNCWRSGAYAETAMRVHCWRPPSHGGPPRLADEWAYLSAQTAAGLGPGQYEQLVQPSSERLAAPYAACTVYYHGCECLDAKAAIIARLPNLRRFHVSPWTSVAAAAAVFRGSVVLEVHDHPARVFFGGSRDQMRRSLRRLVDEAGDCPLDLNLSDIHSVNGHPELLRQWVQEAREAGAR